MDNLDKLDKLADIYFQSENTHSYADTEEELKEDITAAFKAGYKVCMEEWRKCFLSCSSPYCADKFPTVEINGIMGNMDKVDKSIR